MKYGWSRNVLVYWIDSDLYQRQGKAQTNFERMLPDLQSDLARQTL
jgi:predicted nuclease of restriction endonuclease-like (RecB) superfamily